MSGEDYLLEAAIAALSGGAKAYDKYTDTQLEEALMRKKIKLEEESKIRVAEQMPRRNFIGFDPTTGEAMYQEYRGGATTRLQPMKQQESEEERLSRIEKESAARARGYGTQGYRDVKNEIELRKEFINRPEIKEYQTIKTQVNSMEGLLSESLKGNEDSKLALDQGLITMFNKLTDPNSVVRESEYERTPANLSLMNRVSGAFKKLKEGGAGLTDDDRRTLVKGAKVIANSRGKTFNDVRKEYENLANTYKFNPENVVGTLRGFEPYSFEEPKPKKGGLPPLGTGKPDKNKDPLGLGF